VPYKSAMARRRRYRLRRRVDKQWVHKYREYQRKYQKQWRRKNLAHIRDYNRRYARVWRAKHPIKVRRIARAWRMRHPDKVRGHNTKWYKGFGKAWYRKNRARRRAQARQQYRKERRLKPAQQRARRKRYYWRNRDRINVARKLRRAHDLALFRKLDRQRYARDRLRRIVQQRNTQARRARAAGEILPDQWRRLLRRHKFRCFYCGAKLFPANRTLDHKIPICRGGSNTIRNVVPACRPCNNRKMRMTTEEFLRYRNTRKKFQ
jgi:5-methylcytosine-specific restriction endonuclease McrA